MTLRRLANSKNALLVLLLIIAALYGGCHLFHGWVPHDEGVLAQSAERVRQGQIPHRDFDEMYSGGLSFFNAAAFSMFGARLRSLRIVLFIVYLPFLAALYALATRWVRPACAFGFGLLCLAWGPVVYAGALPSWYNTIFAGYGAFFLMKFLESDRRRWLVSAGLAAGVSVCIKITGVYFLFAAVVCLLYRARERGPLRAPAIAVWFGIVALLIRVLGKRLGINEGLNFLLPAALLSALPALASRDPEVPSLKPLGLDMAALLAGFAAPVGGLSLWYLRSGAFADFLTGVFILPQKRYGAAYFALRPLWTMLSVVPLAALFGISRRPLRLFFSGALLGVAMLGFIPSVYGAVWMTLRPLVPALAVVGAWLLLKRTAAARSALENQRLYLALAVMAFVSLVQFPYSFGLYFCYIAPFVALAALAVLQTLPVRASPIPLALLAAYGLFAVLWLDRANVRGVGALYLPRRDARLMLPERAGLVVSDTDEAMYAGLVQEIKRRSGDSEFIYAGPDCPEVYFLSGKKNPTRVFYEFYVPAHAAPDVLLKAIRDRGVRVVVLNGRPEFSARVNRDFYKEILRRFPHVEDFGLFRLFW